MSHPSQGETMKRILNAAVISAAILLNASPIALATSHSTEKSAAATLTDGEIRKIDKDAKKLTIRHAALENLNMPPMTMVFQVKDQAMLDAVKTGDKVKFTADK